MKKQFSILTVLFLLFALTMQAQDENSGGRIFKKFKVDVSFGYAMPQESQGPGNKAGVLFAIEPKFAVIDELSVG